MDKKFNLKEHANQTIGAALLQQSGVTSDLVKRSVARIDEALDAKVTKRVRLKSDEILEFNDVDHNTRLRAADRALDLATRANKVPAKSQSRDKSGGGNIFLTVVLADGTIKEITSPKVIEQRPGFSSER